MPSRRTDAVSSANGLAAGAGAFANSYATLGAMGIYEPMWRYDRRTLAEDLSAHLVFGLARGLAYRALSGSRNGAVPPDA